MRIVVIGLPFVVYASGERAMLLLWLLWLLLIGGDDLLVAYLRIHALALILGSCEEVRQTEFRPRIEIQPIWLLLFRRNRLATPRHPQSLLRSIPPRRAFTRWRACAALLLLWLRVSVVGRLRHRCPVGGLGSLLLLRL